MSDAITLEVRADLVRRVSARREEIIRRMIMSYHSQTLHHDMLVGLIGGLAELQTLLDAIDQDIQVDAGVFKTLMT